MVLGISDGSILFLDTTHQVVFKAVHCNQRLPYISHSDTNTSNKSYTDPNYSLSTNPLLEPIIMLDIQMRVLNGGLFLFILLDNHTLSIYH